jgi:hypothetical protein
MAHYDDELVEINRKSKSVCSKRGILAMYEGMDGYSVFDLYEGLDEIDIYSPDELEEPCHEKA